MTGWAPSPKQPKPAARGSGTVSFQDLEKAMKDHEGEQQLPGQQGLIQQPVTDQPELVR